MRYTAHVRDIKVSLSQPAEFEHVGHTTRYRRPGILNNFRLEIFGDLVVERIQRHPPDDDVSGPSVSGDIPRSQRLFHRGIDALAFRAQVERNVVFGRGR